MTKVDLDQKATPREQVLFGLVAVVLTILFFRVFFSEQTKQIELFKNRHEALQMEKEALIKFASSTPSLEKSEILSKRKGAKVKILTGEVRSAYRDVTTLLNSITNPGFLAGITVENMSYLSSVQDQGYLKTDFTINLRGSFMGVLLYIERLEQFPALFDVENVSLKVAEGQPQDVQVEILGHFFQMGSDISANLVSNSGGS